MKKTDNGNVQIGWASRDVTPGRPVNLQGQFHMRISKGVKDPVTVTALAISLNGSPDDAVIFVSCDSVYIPEQVFDKCRVVVRKKMPEINVNRLIINGTHTHTAPGLRDGLYPPVPAGVMTPQEYAELFVERLTEAIIEAWQNCKPGGISFGLGTAVVGHNRRATYFADLGALPNSKRTGLITDGYTKMYGNTNDSNFSHIEGYEDHYVDLLYTWDNKENLTGVVVNLACPSQETESDYYVSADFWHNIRQEIRKRHGENIQILAQCSSAGDQSPHLLWYKEAEQRMLKLRGLIDLSHATSWGGLNMRPEIGRRVANAVDDVLPLARQNIQKKIPLVHVVEEIKLPRRLITEEKAAEVRADLAKLEAVTPEEQNQDSAYFARQAGIGMSIENFPGAASPFVISSDILEAIRGVPGLKLTYDNGNVMTGGEDPAVSFTRCAAHTVHAHFKDWVLAERGKGTEGLDGRYYEAALIGEGIVSHCSCLEAMKKAEYKGYINIEYENNKYPPDEATRRAVNYLQAIMT